MRVLFVYSEQDPYSIEKPLETWERMQFGISYISSFLKREGHETELVVLSRETPELLETEMMRFDPGIVCCTGVYSEFPFLSEVVTSARKKFKDVFFMFGGPHATISPFDCLKGPFDAICVGEGEYPTLEAVTQIERGRYPSKIPNLYIKNRGKIEVNKPRAFIDDLDSLPFPDRKMWERWIYNLNSRPSVLVGRGCPFKCTYCSNHAIAKVSPGKYVRLRSPDNIVAELSEMKKEKPDFGEIYLEVETLGVNRKWAYALCEKLARFNRSQDSPVLFGSNLRITPGARYDDLFEAFAECGFRFINIGLESGSARIRSKVLERNYSNADVIRAVKSAKRHGLQVGMYNLIGIPGETRRDFRETVRMNRICQPDWYLMSVFFPYPGTVLHDRCAEMGILIDAPDIELERRKPVLKLPGFSKSQVRRRLTFSPLLIYGGFRPAREVAWLIAMGRIFSDRKLILGYRKFERFVSKVRAYRGR